MDREYAVEDQPRSRRSSILLLWLTTGDGGDFHWLREPLLSEDKTEWKIPRHAGRNASIFTYSSSIVVTYLLYSDYSNCSVYSYLVSLDIE